MELKSLAGYFFINLFIGACCFVCRAVDASDDTFALTDTSVIEQQLRDFDDKKAAEQAFISRSDEAIMDQLNELETMQSFRSGMTGTYGRQSFNCQDHDHYMKEQCTQRLYGGINYYDSTACLYYRSCHMWYKKIGADDANIRSAQKRIERLRTTKAAASNRLQAVESAQTDLLSSVDSEWREPTNIEELTERTTMKFDSSLQLRFDPALGIWTLETNEGCRFTVSSQGGDTSWSTGGPLKPDIWTIVQKNPDDRVIKSGSDCLSAYSPPSQADLCLASISKSGKFLAKAGVEMTSSDYPNQALRVEGSSSDVMSCLKKRGLKPNKILVKKIAIIVPAGIIN